MSTNPYVSPQADCSPVADTVDAEYARRQMLGAIRMYWWMGVVGATFHSVIVVAFFVGWIVTGAAWTGEEVMGLCNCMLSLTPSCFSIYVARRLTTRPQGMLSHARLAGIILATVWFPILTVPAIICVRRVTRHHAIYCESMSAKADCQQVENEDA